MILHRGAAAPLLPYVRGKQPVRSIRNARTSYPYRVKTGAIVTRALDVCVGAVHEAVREFVARMATETESGASMT